MNYKCVFARILLQPPCVRACVLVLQHMAASSGLLQQKNIVFQELQARKKSLNSAEVKLFHH